MPLPLLETTDVDYMRQQFIAWMDGARARARGLTMQDIPDLRWIGQRILEMG